LTRRSPGLKEGASPSRRQFKHRESMNWNRRQGSFHSTRRRRRIRHCRLGGGRRRATCSSNAETNRDRKYSGIWQRKSRGSDGQSNNRLDQPSRMAPVPGLGFSPGVFVLSNEANSFDFSASKNDCTAGLLTRSLATRKSNDSSPIFTKSRS